MKYLRKAALVFIFAVLLIGSILTIGAAADDGITVYLVPDSNWCSDNARFAVYTWVGSDYRWIEMTDADGDDIYEATLPAGHTDLIFCRLDPNNSHTGWSTTWNQTVDLTIPDNGDNLFTIIEPWGNDTNDKKATGDWSKYDASACAHKYENDICAKCGEERFYIIAGNVAKIDGEYRDGDNSTLFVSEWNIEDENNRMLYDEENGCYVKIYENVARGEYHFKIAMNKSWDVSYGQDGKNYYLEVEEDGSTVVITLKDGSVTASAKAINVPDDTENPDDSQNEPEQKLNFFEKIWRAIVNFFKNLFGKKK